MTRLSDLDRRTLLGLAGSAALVLLLPPPFAKAAASRRWQGLIALADERYADSVAFASALEAQGAEMVPLARDLARAWSADIAPRLAAGAHAAAGLTLSADLFGLERLAEGSGVATVFVRHVTPDRAPGPGRPSQFVSWMLRREALPSAWIG